MKNLLQWGGALLELAQFQAIPDAKLMLDGMHLLLLLTDLFAFFLNKNNSNNKKESYLVVVCRCCFKVGRGVDNKSREASGSLVYWQRLHRPRLPYP